MDKAKCYFCEREIGEEDIFVGMPLVSSNYRDELSGRVLPMCYKCVDKLKRIMTLEDRLNDISEKVDKLWTEI